MPPLPNPPAPGATDTGMRPQLATTRLRASFPVDVPRYFIEVKVPGYSVEKTVASARKAKAAAAAIGSRCETRRAEPLNRRA